MPSISSSDKEFISALSKVPQLQSLSIRLSPAYFNIADFLQFGQLLPEQMRYIEIRFCNSKEETHRIDRYDHMKDPLNGVCYLNDFIPRFPMLEVLFVRGAPYSNLRGVFLSYMPHTLRRLELLNHDLDGLELRHLAENCKNLEFLRVSLRGTVDMAHLKKVCVKLKVFELDLFHTNFVGLEKQSIFAPELKHFLYRHYLSSPMTDDEQEFLSKFLTHGIFEHSEKLQSIMLDFCGFSHWNLTPAQRQIDFFITLGNYHNLQALSLGNVIIFDDTLRNICVNNANLQLLQLMNTSVTVEGFLSSLQQNARPKQLGFRTHYFDYSAYDLHQGLCKYLDEQYDVNERPTGSDDPRILHFGGMFNDITEKYYDGFANMHPFIMLHWWTKLLPKCAYGFYPDNVNLWKYSSVNIYSWDF
ncbi:hypothetical protein Ddc_18488 [Ditylenchus destructor]|nr:hypothetical protein Ddc_18488 [Ditylenchus destructor]